MVRTAPRSLLRRSLKPVLLTVVGLLLAAQLVPVNRSNPPVESGMIAPADVMSVLRRSCYDCHSSETAWPWYGRIAPVSWLIARDVREGREAVNYSTWGRYTAEERAELRAETWEDVEEDEMPLALYTLAHPGARLSDEDRATLRAWSLTSHVNHAKPTKGER